MSKEKLSPELLDDESRVKLTEVLDKNFIVEAGAGSGKTTSLVKRMVSMVEHGIDVSTISCITFTKAAANEFYERFQDLLSKRSNINYKYAPKRKGDLPLITEESASNCQKALKDIDLCFMGTIDAFVQKIMNEHPYEFGIPANVKVIDESKEDKYIKDFYYDILNGLYKEEAPGLDYIVKESSRYISKDSNFITGIKYFLKIRANNIIYDKLDNIEATIDEVFSNEIKKTKKILHNFMDFIKEHNLKSTKGFDDAYKNLRILDYSWDKYYFGVIKELNACKGLSMSKKDSIEYNFEPTEGIELPEDRKTTLKISSDYIDLLLKNLNDHVSRILFYAFDECAKFISSKFKALGYSMYSDFIINMRNSLKEDAKGTHNLIRYIQKNRKYYLLDEFQDTNPLQTEIFFYLTAEKIDEDYTKCIPFKGSLFIVGDPKQSIYRFTGADVTCFLTTKELFEKDPNGEVLYLTKNFRSTKVLRNFFNEVMPTALDTGVDQTEYIDIPFSPVSSLDSKASFHGIYKYKDIAIKEGNKTSFDFNNVVNIIKNIVDNKDYTILSKDKNGEDILRTINYGDFMIITPTKPVLKSFMNVLSEANIPYFTEGATAFEESSALNEIKTLFNSLVEPSNINYLYRALQTSYVFLSELEIRKIVAKLGRISLFEDDIEVLEEAIKTKYQRMLDLYSNTSNMTYSSKLLYLIENTQIYNRHNATFMEYVYYAYELIRIAENDGTIITPQSAIDFLSNVNSNNKDYERCFGLNNDQVSKNKIHLANLHKTKGLEAPIVILAYPKPSNTKKIEYRTERINGKADTYVICIQPEEKGFNKPLICSSSKYGINGSAHIEPTLKVVDEINSLESERRRLEYVAATRARNALIIAEYYTNSKGEISKQNGYWDNVMNDEVIDITNLTEDKKFSLEDSRTRLKASDLYDKSIENRIIDESCNEKSYSLKKPSEIKTVINISYDEDVLDDIKATINIDENNPQEVARKEACIKGTLAHRMMELLVNSKGTLNREDAIRIINNEFYPMGDKYRWMLENIHDVMNDCGFKQKNGHKQNLLEELKSAKQTLCEVPFSYLDGTNLYHGIMDLVYQDSNGKWHILDYKTNKEKDVSKLEKEYKTQLEGYIKSFKETTNLEADAIIYHIEIE